MSDFLALLRSRIEDTRRRLQEATERMHQATKDVDMLQADLKAWEGSLAAEMRSAGMPATIELPQTAPGQQTDQSGPQTADVNKADFARQYIQKNGDRGVTPNDIFQAFTQAGIPIKRPYVYSLIQRLKTREIRERRGRWYPVQTEQPEKVLDEAHKNPVAA